MQPLVSVLVPSYNHERYIVQCLDSVVADGYGNLELIILDDGSTDSTCETAARWLSANKDRFSGGVHLSRQANQGVVKTLNTLVSRANGDYFTLLASDDCLLPGGIEARIDYLRRHPQHLAVFADAVGIDEAGAETCASVLRDRYGADKRALRCERTRGLELILQWCVPGPVYLARKEVLTRIGKYDERYCFEDRDYYLRLIGAGALGFVDRTVAAYRILQAPSRTRHLQLEEHLSRIHEDLLPTFRGLNRLAMTTLVARQHKKSLVFSSGWTKLRNRAIAWLLPRLRRLNRLMAVLSPAGG